jgi:predicted nucleotidyltransferase
MSTDSNIIAQIKRIVYTKFPSAKVYLYGSRIKGTANKDSDWDLLILLKEKNISAEIEDKITSPLYDLEFETGEIISPMVYSEDDWNNLYNITPFYKNVMKEGQLL